MLGKNAEKELLANMEEIRYMTRSIVRKSAIFAKYMDIEDFYQEAYIEYLQSVDSYDHTKGKSLHNYAYSRIRHRLMSIFRKNRNIYQEYGSNKLEEQLSCRQDVESELRAAEFAVDYLEVEKEMMKVYMDAPKTIQYGILAICNEVRGISKAETAKKLGITTSYITVSMRRAADKLKLPVMFAWYGYHNLKGVKMANPYRKVMYRLKEKWSIREIAELYVDRNFSMDLVSHITGIPLALLSHILWDYHLPEVKSKYYTENFLGEISKLTKQMHAEFFREERIFTRQYENDRRKMETDFLAEIS